MKRLLVPFLICLLASPAVWAQASVLKTIELPSAQMTGGMPVLEALAKRSTARTFDVKELSTQQLSNILWAAFGINRPDGKRTAPSSMDRKEIDIYVLLKSGVYVWDAKKNRLDPLFPEDIRALGGKQAFVKEAPLTLVFVADHTRMSKASQAEQDSTAAMDTGFISQNVYLYCASEGLATGVRGWLDREVLGKRLGLRADQSITAAQSVGYPKK